MADHPPSRATAPGSSARSSQLYWATVVGLVALVWLAPGIPTQDGPSHLYNLALISELLGDAPPRSDLHALQFNTLTNLGFLVVGMPLAQVIPLWAVERAVLSLHVVLIAWFSTLWLAQTGRRSFPIAWVGLGFCLPWSLFMGFYGYQLGADIALLALCVMWRKRESDLLTLAAIAAIGGTFALVFHAVAAALFVGLSALMQLSDPRTATPARVGRALTVSAPVLLIVVATVSGGSSNESPLQWQNADYVLLTLVTFGTLSFASQLTTCLLVVFAWILLCLPGETPRRRDHATRFALLAGVAIAALHIALPDRMSGGGYLTGRFAWWIPLITLPLLETSALFAGRLQRELVPYALAFVALGSTVISAAPDARLVAQVSEAARTHPSSGIVATAIFDRTLRSNAMIEPLRHVASLFVREQGVLMTNYQARVSFFPLRFTDAAKARFPHIDINSAWETDWSKLPISELVSIDATEEDRRVLSKHFAHVWKSEQNRVELWRKR